MKKQPVLSIITICRNAQDSIAATLESVAQQQYRSIQYIVVDGASTDHTLEVIRKYEWIVNHLISEPDGGIYDAMNKGLQAATGDYLLFLNAGDALYSPHVLQSIFANLPTPEPDIIYGETALVDAQRQPVGMRHLRAPEELSYESFKWGMMVCHQSFIVRRSIAPLYRLKYRFSADYEWCIRCLQSAKSTHNTRLIITNYLNQGITTANRKASLKERYEIMCRYHGRTSTWFRHLYFALRFLLTGIQYRMTGAQKKSRE